MVSIEIRTEIDAKYIARLSVLHYSRGRLKISSKAEQLTVHRMRSQWEHSLKFDTAMGTGGKSE